MPQEYIDFQIRQNLYGGLTPLEFENQPSEIVYRDWWFYITTNKLQEQKRKKDKKKKSLKAGGTVEKTTLNQFMGDKD